MKSKPHTGYNLFEEHSYLSRNNVRHVVKILKAANGTEEYKILTSGEGEKEALDYWHLRFLDPHTARKTTAAHLARFRLHDAGALV